ncbi:putative glycoside hydrolase family 76 protein [Lyophyllum shimeji]|uniref:Glycoside hydrolase family 76 protein n=1 Tax=Lyophyllum shimeji TaxID=47721 RepID=A0A9P3UUP2_LYOSH|nr:putative glycoside hydrolase family 76 protein [Lyophyllum shimeji]
MLLSAPIVLLAVGLAAAQDLGVPLTWRKFSNSRPLSERISISQNAINAILPQLNSATGEFNGIGYWQSGNVWSAMANQDKFAGTTTNQAQVYNDDALWWAQAALYAYRAYGDTTLLNNAIATWNHVTNYALTPAQANAGSSPYKSFTISGTCDGVTMAGGVFWRPTSDDQSINSITTGLYLTVSAFLAEITQDPKYTNAAIQAAAWIKAHNINSDNIVLDSVNAHDCSRSPATWLFTYNSGKYIEGLSVLADVTGDSQWRTLMVNIVAAATKSPAWEGSDGIITEGSSTTSNNDGVGFKAIFIRGLFEAFNRNAANTDLRILIHSYIDVQYNALLDLAANGNTYSANWHGPPQGFTTWGQLASLDVFVSAILAN